MPAILKPDMKALTWAALGFFVAPHLIKMVRR